MTNPRQLSFAGLLQNEVNLGWSIILSKFIETEVPEFGRVLVWVKSGVLSRVDASSVVAKPDIKASMGKEEGNRVGSIGQPGFSRGKQTVLQENNWLAFVTLNMHGSEQVTIRGLNLELLVSKASTLNNL